MTEPPLPFLLQICDLRDELKRDIATVEKFIVLLEEQKKRGASRRNSIDDLVQAGAAMRILDRKRHD